MDANMQTTIIILWLSGVVCGTAFFVGLGTLVWNVWKKHFDRLAPSFIAIAIGIIGMSNSIFTILRLFRSWL